jgi:MFS transporter, Spinster family, sphingosine-1-phosphate transporter
MKHKHYLLTLLTGILAFNYVDRLALGLAVQDIKSDFNLSDTQLGLLSGIAFALFYSIMGIPIARWSDRGNRVLIISMSTALWSAAVALTGLAVNFLQLILARVVVGIGEAGCVPPANSLIADLFTREERPRAMSVYMQGVSVSLVVGYLVAGWLIQFYGWRAMFVTIGLPGLGLAAMAWLTLREPRRSEPKAGTTTPQPPVTEVFVTLWRSITFRHLLYSYSVMFFFSYGMLQWTPAFFVRSFGLKAGELGTLFGVVYGVGGVVGTYLGGEWAVRRAANNECLQLKAMGIVISACGILAACAFIPAFSPHYSLAMGWLALSNVVGIMANGPFLAVLQTLVSERMRAMSIALVYLFANLIGLGLGPWAAGALSDSLRPWAGEESLRYALLLLCPGFVWSAWHLWCASRTVVPEIRATQEEDLLSRRCPAVAVKCASSLNPAHPRVSEP